MERCINCCSELVPKKYNGVKRLKCLECGYETSKNELEQETNTFIESIKNHNKKTEEENTDE